VSGPPSVVLLVRRPGLPRLADHDKEQETMSDYAELGGEKPLSPHDLRHSCAALLLAAGTPAPRVAAIMRHADPRVTLTVYARIADRERAALRDDLEAAFS